jgi:hypothetical protein
VRVAEQTGGERRRRQRIGAQHVGEPDPGLLVTAYGAAQRNRHPRPKRRPDMMTLPSPTVQPTGVSVDSAGPIIEIHAT